MSILYRSSTIAISTATTKVASLVYENVNTHAYDDLTFGEADDIIINMLRPPMNIYESGLL